MGRNSLRTISLILSAQTLFICRAGAQEVRPFPQADALLQQMTLEEKAELLVGSIEGTSYTGVPMPTGNEAGYQRVPGAAGQTNTIPRLGIPPTVVADGPAGLRVMPHRDNDAHTYYCTGFPVEILLSSTWNTDILESVGEAMGNEVLEYGVDVILGPATNIMRNPLCGRNFEYFSEDPFLAGKMTAAITRGIQSQGVGTSVKHFAANNQETNRYGNDSRVSPRALREIYLKPFEIAVKEASPWTIMSSYNRINGEYTQSSHDLLTKILRQDWGFDGIVMTDWSGVRETDRQIAAGNDLLMPGKKEQIEQIVAAVEEGRLSEKDVDACVRRMLKFILKTPRHRDYQFSNRPDLEGHAAVSRMAAEEGIVLLKNEAGVLPLKEKCQKVALLGVSSYNFIHDGFGSGHVNTPYIVNMIQGLRNHGIGYHEGLASYYEHRIATADAEFAFSPLSKIPLLETIGIGSHVEDEPMPSYVFSTLASESDLAIITIGRKPGEGFDRDVKDDFLLSEAESQMILQTCTSFHAAGKKVIVVLNVGGVIETASWKDLPDAIVLAWMPGQEGGNAIADILCGNINPSGKLPITFPVCYEDVPGSNDFPQGYGKDYNDGMNGLSALLNPKKSIGNTRNYDYTEYTEGIYVGYRHYTTKNVPVSYPFGFGLSYTSFVYSEPEVSRKGEHFLAKIKVTNTGYAAGKEAVQLYVSAPDGKLDKPELELKAFAKTRFLQPGESQTLEMEFSAYDLASFDEPASAFITDSGVYEALFCSNVGKIEANVSFRMPKTKKWTVHKALLNE